MDHRLVRKELLDKCNELDVLNPCVYLYSIGSGGKKRGETWGAGRYVEHLPKWGERNFELNNLRGDYDLIQADCFSWMREQRGKQVSLMWSSWSTNVQ